MSKTYDSAVFLKSLRKSERMGKLNAHIACLKDDKDKLLFVIDLAKKENWLILERNAELLLARANAQNEPDETIVDFLDACDALRTELQNLDQ